MRTAPPVGDDDYGDDPDGSPFQDGSWLAADYTVSCRSDRYKAHAVYAIFCIFVYPVGASGCVLLRK